MYTLSDIVDIYLNSGSHLRFIKFKQKYFVKVYNSEFDFEGYELEKYSLEGGV